MDAAQVSQAIRLELNPEVVKEWLCLGDDEGLDETYEKSRK